MDQLSPPHNNDYSLSSSDDKPNLSGLGGGGRSEGTTLTLLPNEGEAGLEAEAGGRGGRPFVGRWASLGGAFFTPAVLRNEEGEGRLPGAMRGGPGTFMREECTGGVGEESVAERAD